MKAIQFAMESILDASTGYGLPHSSAGITSAAKAPHSRRSLARKMVNYLERLRSGIGVAVFVLRKRRELKRDLRELSSLNDRMLEDIGLTRGDILAAENGYLDREQLEQQRIHNRDKRRILPRKAISSSGRIAGRTALNDAVFARARCA